MTLFHKHPSVSPWKIGLLQTAVVVAYILTGALIVTSPLNQRLPERLFELFPPLGILAFLTTFVFSALFCATTMLGYPFLLFFQKEYRRGIQVILWSIAWLAIALLGIGMIGLANLSIQA